MIAKDTEKPTQKRPDPSPLLKLWTAQPRIIDAALIDTAPSIDAAKVLRRELDACGRGQIDPDSHGLRMLWAYLGLAGAHGILDAQRAWHAAFIEGGAA